MREIRRIQGGDKGGTSYDTSGGPAGGIYGGRHFGPNELSGSGRHHSEIRGQASDQSGYHTYSYLAPSEIGIDGLRTEVWVTTSGGMAHHPYLFFGTVRNGRVVGRSLATVLDNSHQDAGRTRVISPVKDAIITAHEESLRFESFSADAGVYARLDVDSDMLYGDITGMGATSMDALPGFRSRLKSIVGNFVLAVGTSDGPRSGERWTKVVALPSPWLRGLSEAGVIASASVLEFELSGAQGRQALHSLVRHSGAHGLAGLRMVAGRPVVTTAGAVEGLPIACPKRLEPLLSILPDVESVRIYSHRHHGSEDLATVSFVLDLDGVSITWMLSADHTVGFTGDRDALDALVNVHPDVLSDVDPFLTNQYYLSESSFSRALGISHRDAIDIIAALAASGRAGYDLTAQSFFQRDLPFPDVGKTQARLVEARRLVDAGAISSRGSVLRVSQGSVTNRVTRDAGGFACTCSVDARTSDLCDHVIAVKYWEVHPRGETRPYEEAESTPIAVWGGGR
ncbi:MAG: hypothetical protein HKO10_10210 [Acidimicrobiia bacterium]|nr:hypothetical protein [Acidimicrobiia bacterium]